MLKMTENALSDVGVDELRKALTSVSDALSSLS